MDKYSRGELESALAGAQIIVERAGETIRARDARIADLEAAARNLLDLVRQGQRQVRYGRVVRECVLPEDAVTQILMVLDRRV